MPNNKFEDSLTYYSKVLSRQIRRFGKALSDDSSFESEFGWISNYNASGNERLELCIISVCLVRVFTAIKWYIATMESPIFYTSSQLEERNRILREIKYNLASLQNRLEKYADEISFLSTPGEEKKCLLAEEKIRDILSVLYRKPYQKKEDQDGWNLLITEQINSIRRASWQAGHNEGELTLVNDLKAILDIAQQITTNIERKNTVAPNKRDRIRGRISKCPCGAVDSVAKDHTYNRSSHISSVSVKESSIVSTPRSSPQRTSPILSDSDEVFDGTDLSTAWECVRQTVLRKKNVPKLQLDLSDSDCERAGNSTFSSRKSDKHNEVVSECSSFEYESHSDISVLSHTLAADERRVGLSEISSSLASAASSYYETSQFPTAGSNEDSVSVEGAQLFRPIRNDDRFSSPISSNVGNGKNELIYACEGCNLEWNQATMSTESTPFSTHSSFSGRHGEHAHCYRDFAISDFLQASNTDNSGVQELNLYRSLSPDATREMDISPSTEFNIESPCDGSLPDMETTIIRRGEHSCSEVNSESSVTSSRVSYSPVTGCSVEVHTSMSQRRREQIETDVCQTIILNRPIPLRLMKRPRYDLYAGFILLTSFVTFFAIMWYCFPTTFRASRPMFPPITRLELVYLWSIIDCIKSHIQVHHFGPSPI